MNEDLSLVSKLFLRPGSDWLKYSVLLRGNEPFWSRDNWFCNSVKEVNTWLSIASRITQARNQNSVIKPSQRKLIKLGNQVMDYLAHLSLAVFTWGNLANKRHNF